MADLSVVRNRKISARPSDRIVHIVPVIYAELAIYHNELSNDRLAQPFWLILNPPPPGSSFHER
jgi:hypothetical protein